MSGVVNFCQITNSAIMQTQHVFFHIKEGFLFATATDAGHLYLRAGSIKQTMTVHFWEKQDQRPPVALFKVFKEGLIWK